MDPKSAVLQQRIREFKDGLKRSGIKMTHQRLEIFQEIAKSGAHPDAEAIYKGVRARVPSVSLDTVYRTLWLFLDLGLITTLGPPRERNRFDANMSPHHHFICTKCGVALDFYSETFDRLEIPEDVKALGTVEKAQVEVRGLCPQCSKKGSSPNRASRKQEGK